jgi:hypothetical protein
VKIDTQAKRKHGRGVKLTLDESEASALGELLSYLHNADLSHRATRMHRQLTAVCEALDGDLDIADEDTRASETYRAVRRKFEPDYKYTQADEDNARDAVESEDREDL